MATKPKARRRIPVVPSRGRELFAAFKLGVEAGRTYRYGIFNRVVEQAYRDGRHDFKAAELDVLDGLVAGCRSRALKSGNYLDERTLAFVKLMRRDVEAITV